MSRREQAGHRLQITTPHGVNIGSPGPKSVNLRIKASE
jgi:hypothetical protein